MGNAVGGDAAAAVADASAGVNDADWRGMLNPPNTLFYLPLRKVALLTKTNIYVRKFPLRGKVHTEDARLSHGLETDTGFIHRTF